MEINHPKKIRHLKSAVSELISSMLFIMVYTTMKYFQVNDLLNINKLTHEQINR